MNGNLISLLKDGRCLRLSDGCITILSKTAVPIVRSLWMLTSEYVRSENKEYGFGVCLPTVISSNETVGMCEFSGQEEFRGRPGPPPCENVVI